MLPGLFLLTLGLGNIFVGVYKAQEYELVIVELTALSAAGSAEALQDLAPVKRIQLSNQNQERIYERLQKAEARRDLYHLVRSGGIFFVFLSALLLIGGLCAKSVVISKR